jgi:hypothetical protein
METFEFNALIDKVEKLNLTVALVPKEMVEKVGGLGTRLMCSINGCPEFHCGLVAYGDGQGYIIINKKKMKRFDIELGEAVSLTLRHDNSKYGMEMPEELEVLLEQDPEGAKLFEALSDGKKRYIIYYVSSVKSSQLKIDRSIMMINNLKTMGEKFDFRHLLGKPPRSD